MFKCKNIILWNISIFLYSQVCILNSKDYEKETLNNVRRFFRFEQYRKVHFYNIGYPNLDSEAFGYMSNNLSEEAFAYAKQLKRKVIMFTSTNIRLNILL